MREEIVQKFYDYLRKKGLKVTKERTELIKWIAENEHGHFTADELQNHLQNAKLKVSRATIYRTLEVLEEARLISAVMFDGTIRHYELSYNQNEHDHIICVKCSKVIEFCDETLHSRVHEICEQRGYDIISHHTKVFAVCAECREGAG